MVEGRTECTAHLLPVPSYTSPHDGAEEQGRGRGGAGWLAISGGQVTTSCSEESKLPTEESKLPTEESKLPTEESKLPTEVYITKRKKTKYIF
jgi:hypothetical protein